jgi:hypothetical protein
VDTATTGNLDIYVVNYGSAGGGAVVANGFLVQSITAPGIQSGSFSVSVAGLNFSTSPSEYIGFVVNHNTSPTNTTNFVIEATLFFQW